MRPAEDKNLYYFRNGDLFIAEHEYLTRIHGWPEPVVLRKLWHNSPKPYEPESRLVAPPTRKRRSTSAARDSRQLSLPLGTVTTFPNSKTPISKEKAFRCFRATLPWDLAGAIQIFHNHQWRLIIMVHILREPAMDLLHSNPALAFALANNRTFGKIMKIPERRAQAEKVIHMKQRDLLRALKFPATKSMVNMIGKTRPQSASPETLETLRTAVAEEKSKRWLTQVPAINTGVLGLIGDTNLWEHFGPGLLRDVAAEARENFFPFAANRLGEVLNMYEVARPGETAPRFASTKRLQECHDELSVDFQRRASGKLKYCRIPRPPLPGTDTIVPLRTHVQLKQEGNEQRNCVATYVTSVAGGNTYIYKVLKPERATLSVVKDAGGTWHRGDLKLAGNRPVSDETSYAVNKWLAGHSVAAGE